MTAALHAKETPKQAAARLAVKALAEGYKPQALHTYTSSEKLPLYWRIRLKHPDGRKWIRPMKWDGSGYTYGEPEFSEGKPLYRLHELAARRDDPVFVVEGEWCADNLAKLGVLATTSGAADSASKADWRALEGRHVVIWPDHDEAGQRYAEGVAAILLALGCAVEVVDVGALALPPKGDAVDWLEQHPDTTAADVQALPMLPHQQDTSTPGPPEEVARIDPIAEAIARLSEDAGAIFEPAILDALREVRAGDPAQWARYRQAIKATKVVSLPDLDRITQPDNASNGGTCTIFAEVEAWPEAVDGGALLDDIAEVLRTHVIADAETIHAAALWAAFTWFIDVVNVAPIANITAPEKRCGKTVMLGALARLSYRPLAVSNIAPAALFRALELWCPTLLIDEVDAFLSEHEEARGILNAGFTRDTAFVIRCVGDDHLPTRFNVWGAKALCGIGKIADTLADRSIPLRLRRKVPGERTTKIRHADGALFGQLCQKLARFANDNRDTIRQARPAEIEGLNDRANDCWEPLLAIAEAAGGHWPKRARHAAAVLHGLEEEAPSAGAELLRDVQAIFETKRTARLFSSELLTALCDDDEAPWSTWNRGKPITPRQLSERLKGFGIKSRQMRRGYENKKGYELADCIDAFNRYLTDTNTPPFPATPSASETAIQASNGAGYSVSDQAKRDTETNTKETRKPSNGAGCIAVSHERGVAGRVEQDNPTQDDVAFF